MLIIMTFCLLGIFLNPFNVFDWASQHTFFLHQMCLASSPVAYDYKDIWQALVCGQGLHANPTWSHSLKASGLIHIFVVSGSHFLVIGWLLGKVFFLPEWAKYSLFWAFNAMTGFSAPGTRACLALCLQNRIKTLPHQKTWVVGMLSLALQPAWIFSYSFWLSWLASFLLIMAPQDRFRISQNLLFFTSWSLLGSHLSLWSLILNITVAPIIGWVLFPLAVLSFLKPAAWAFEFLLDQLELLLNVLDLTNKKVPFSLSLGGLTFLVLFTHFCLQCFKLEAKGKKIF